jgi:hypothetical protein
MSLFDLQLFTLHVASHLVGEETVRRALLSSNDESSKSRHLFSWRSPPLAPGNGDYDCNGDDDDDESSGTGTDQHQRHEPQEQKEKDEESRTASLVFLEVIFDWHPTITPAALESKSTTSTTPPTTRTIAMHVNALLRMSRDGRGLCVGVVPSGKRSEAAEVRVTLQDLERHFEQISIDVASTPETVLATTFANALLAMHTQSTGGLPSTTSNSRHGTVRVLQSSPGSGWGDVHARIPLCYHDLQETATWTIRQPAPRTTGLDDLAIPAAAMSMWMRSLTPPTAVHIATSTATAFTAGEPPFSAEKATSPPLSVEKQKLKPAPAPVVVDLLTLFQEWRQTPVVKPVPAAADPLLSASEKEHGGAVCLDSKESPGATTTHDNVPVGGSDSPGVQQKQKVVQIKRKHGFTRIPSKKKKTGKLKFAGAD